MKETLEAMVVPTGGMPYRKTLEADEDGSFLAALQDCVGGRIEAMGYVFGDAPAVYCNEEGLLPGSGCAPNRAIYAAAAMAEAGYASQDDPSRPVEPGELYHIAFGDLVCVGFDPETGEEIEQRKISLAGSQSVKEEVSRTLDALFEQEFMPEPPDTDPVSANAPKESMA